NAIKLHGDETIDFNKQLRLNFKNIKIIKALPSTQNIINDINQFKEHIDLFIIDTPLEQYGGTGQSFDWTLLKGLDQSIP
ncbi:phosphoribosylanthranilate isomerase, partial [Staphylococcus haemolyticus]